MKDLYCFLSRVVTARYLLQGTLLPGTIRSIIDSLKILLLAALYNVPLGKHTGSLVHIPALPGSPKRVVKRYCG